MKIKYEGNGQRIDSFLGDFVDELTRSKAQELIKNDKVLVNGNPVKQKYNLVNGDEIEYTIEFQEKGPVTP